MNQQKINNNVNLGNRGLLGTIRKYFSRNLALLGALFVIGATLTLTTPYFLTADNILVVMRMITTNAIVAFGMTFVILMGGIDLTVGSLISVTGILTSSLMAHSGVPMVYAIFIGLLLGASVGFINGIIITKAKLPAFIVTLAVSFICKGFSFIISRGIPISISNEKFNLIGNGYIGPIPLPVVYMFAIFIILSYFLYRTRFGRHVYAIGGNIEAAKFSGINVFRPQIIAYIFVGFLSGFSGIIITARLYSGQPTIGTNAELDAIAAVILGGASLFGGVGTLGGTFLGAIIIGVVNNGLNLLGVNSYWQDVAKGLIILLAVFIDAIKTNRMASLRIKTTMSTSEKQKE